MEVYIWYGGNGEICVGYRVYFCWIGIVLYYNGGCVWFWFVFSGIFWDDDFEKSDDLVGVGYN